jgi:hypothetical protein
MKRTNENGARTERKPGWSVVVVYEDTVARERAMGFCDELVRRFWTQFEFDLSWWSFDLVEEVKSATEAAEKAASADLIVFAAAPEGDFPGPVKAWIETWLGQRGEREGILVGLLDPLAEVAGQQGPRHCCLRQAAHRGALDYLTQVPEDISRSIPDSLDSYAKRADRVTSLLDDILHHLAPPPGLSS